MIEDHPDLEREDLQVAVEVAAAQVQGYVVPSRDEVSGGHSFVAITLRAPHRWRLGSCARLGIAALVRHD